MFETQDRFDMLDALEVWDWFETLDTLAGDSGVNLFWINGDI